MKKTTEMPQPKKEKLKNYSTPVLITYGKLSEFTAGGTAFGKEPTSKTGTMS
jgi:hypothetical protein